MKLSYTPSLVSGLTAFILEYRLRKPLFGVYYHIVQQLVTQLAYVAFPFPGVGLLYLTAGHTFSFAHC